MVFVFFCPVNYDDLSNCLSVGMLLMGALSRRHGRPVILWNGLAKLRLTLTKSLIPYSKAIQASPNVLVVLWIGINSSRKGAVSGSDGMREYDYVYEDRGRKVTMKFYILGDPQPKSLPAVVKSVKEEADKIRRTRTRLGFCVRYLKGILPFGELVKEVRWFDSVMINICIQCLPRSTLLSEQPSHYYLLRSRYVG